MIDLGKVRPGSTIRIPFGSYTGSTGASSAASNFAVGDILIYKDGSTTERASTSGFTATTSFDSVTGINLVVIDLADNTTAGFFAAGSEYFVIVSPITVDSQTVAFPIARFVIGIRGTIFETTIATLSSQTSFTLTAGPAEDDALNGCIVCVHDVASAVQCGSAVVLDYTGSTKTVTLAAGTTFTAAATDNVMFFPPANIVGVTGVLQTGRDIGASVLLSSGTGTGQVSLSNGTVTLTDASLTAAKIAADAITAAKIADGAIDAATFAAGAINAAAIAADAITDAKVAADVTIASVTGAVGSVTGLTAADVAAIKTKTDNLPSDPADESLIIAATDSIISAIEALADETAVADAILDRANAIETGLTLRQALRLIAAASAGKLSGAATTTVVVRNAVADAKARITATVDADGNRSAITTDVT